jgi:hypothetical protein
LKWVAQERKKGTTVGGMGGILKTAFVNTPGIEDRRG